MKKSFADYLALFVSTLTGVVLIVYILSLLYPIFWMLLNGLKDEFDYTMDLFGFPTIWKFENYIDVLKFIVIPTKVEGLGIVNIGIGTMVYNSIFRCVLSPLISVFFKACCAYCLAKYKFPGNNFIFKLGIVVMILPIVGALPSGLMVQKALGTYDNMYLNILLGPSNIFGMDFLILYGGFKSLSWGYAEAAFMDGANHYQVLFRIMLPMLLPLCTVYYVLGFLATWNDYSTILIWLPSYPNMAYGLYYFQLLSTGGAEGTTSPMLLAGFADIMIPSVLLYLACHKVIIAKLTVGGLKG